MLLRYGGGGGGDRGGEEGTEEEEEEEDSVALTRMHVRSARRDLFEHQGANGRSVGCRGNEGYSRSIPFLEGRFAATTGGG